MSKPELTKEREARQRKEVFTKVTETKDKVLYTFTSFCLLVEAIAMAVTSGYAIYAGWYANLPNWGSYALLIAGSFIAIRAFVEFVKFLNRR